MPNRLKNWKFKEATRFLKERGFFLNNVRGSHHYFIGKYAGKLRNVCVPFHSGKSITIKTMEGIILQSGIPGTEWFGENSPKKKKRQ